ncbi:helix-turn-helix domain-containing protein [Streptomyces sp. ID05-47C]|uniref:helix-turn-helix domain-containing protein n=1 Tax=Streptomyces sp. ID05-47C TaxID=3028665 RepID=UPI0029B89E5D|nr:helix-turn-helix domain-containing protein [Streptomyces sp. ID05-47C]MDX3571096.1 helix-turn-helix domain-containing protein [Streptomyces sp. ID05-47C]
MKDPAEGRLSFSEMFDLPVTVDLRTACRAFGIGSTTAYRLIREGEFPCSIRRVGRRYRIPTNELMRALGIEDRPLYSVDLKLDTDGPGADFR